MKPLILLTNDDEIKSPGVAATTEILDPLGDLLIVVPLEQETSMSRSGIPQRDGDGTITDVQASHGDHQWMGLAINRTPAKVTHFPRKGEFSAPGTASHALANGLVTVTPLSLDLTSRISLTGLADLFGIGPPPGENER